MINGMVLKKDLNIRLFVNMKTLITIESSRSISGDKIYF